MHIDSKSVRGRRELKFTSFDDVLADAQGLIASPGTKVLGNWSLSQLLTHLALAIDKSIDGISFRVPWHIRVLGFLIKRQVLRRAMPAGFRLPRDREMDAFPPAPSPQDALATLRRAAARMKSERMTVRHPVYGQLTHEEWSEFHLRHAELHLSFAIPGMCGGFKGL